MSEQAERARHWGFTYRRYLGGWVARVSHWSEHGAARSRRYLQQALLFGTRERHYDRGRISGDICIERHMGSSHKYGWGEGRNGSAHT